jgi:hypothetical protein
VPVHSSDEEMEGKTMRQLLWTALLVGSAAAAFAAPHGDAPVVAILKVTPTQAQPRQALTLRLTVTNRSREEVTLFFRSGMTHDFVVTRDKREVWRWSRGRVFTQAITPIKLQPGESRTFEGTWGQKGNDGEPVPEGQYTITGTVTTRPAIAGAPVTVRIEATEAGA